MNPTVFTSDFRLDVSIIFLNTPIFAHSLKIFFLHAESTVKFLPTESILFPYRESFTFVRKFFFEIFMSRYLEWNDMKRPEKGFRKKMPGVYMCVYVCVKGRKKMNHLQFDIYYWF